MGKKNLYDAFSILANDPQQIFDQVMKEKLSVLEDYGLVESEGDFWRPKTYSPLELTTNIKRICKSQDAPKELLRILSRYRVEFIEDKKKLKKISEIRIQTVGLIDTAMFGEIKKFLRERKLEPEKLELKYVGHSYGSSNCVYSLKYPRLTYGLAEEMGQFLADNFPVENARII